MRFIIFGPVFLFLCLGCQKGQKENLELNHFIEEIDVVTPTEVQEPSALAPRGRLGLYPGGVVVLDAIVNTAETVWNLVERNRAVTQATSLFANALPSGAANGTDLENFSNLNRRSFYAFGKNFYGANVYDVQYTVMYRHGGQYQGRGRYLDQVTVVPTHVQALWGYTVEVSAKAAAPSNVGTKEDPVAALILEVGIKVSTLVKSADTRRVFEFRGDSPDLQEPTAHL